MSANCPVCTKSVAKKGLKCAGACGAWFHTGCAGVEALGLDYSIIVKIHGVGFGWRCTGCRGTSLGPEIRLDELKRALTAEITDGLANLSRMLVAEIGAVTAAVGGVSQRLAELENKPSKPDISFANIVRETIESTKKDTTKGATEVIDQGKPRTIREQQVLIVKPTSEATSYTPPQLTKSIQNALGSVPVNSYSETRSGMVVVKFPTETAKSKASEAIKSSLGSTSGYSVSEPKKVGPKMTLTGISTSMTDDEISSSIANKNPVIKSLIEDGHEFKLLFTKEKEESKIAVIKISPEIRSAIIQEHSCVYVGLTRCRAHDRFWVTQCHHCQGFGHISDNCSKKLEKPRCMFCADSHKSDACTNKNSPKCVNCSSSRHGLASPPVELAAHFASSRHCPIMIAQRKRLIENTNFTSSKN